MYKMNQVNKDFRNKKVLNKKNYFVTCIPKQSKFCKNGKEYKCLPTIDEE